MQKSNIENFEEKVDRERLCPGELLAARMFHDVCIRDLVKKIQEEIIVRGEKKSIERISPTGILEHETTEQNGGVCFSVKARALTVQTIHFSARLLELKWSSIRTITISIPFLALWLSIILQLFPRKTAVERKQSRRKLSNMRMQREVCLLYEGERKPE